MPRIGTTPNLVDSQQHELDGHRTAGLLTPGEGRRRGIRRSVRSETAVDRDTFAGGHAWILPGAASGRARRFLIGAGRRGERRGTALHLFRRNIFLVGGDVPVMPVGILIPPVRSP